MNAKIDPKTIGERLRKLRGIRVRKGVASEMGITYSALSKYEDGLKIPNDSTKVVIANYYGVSVQQIFFEPEYYETT